jgi:hypothetical protein
LPSTPATQVTMELAFPNGTIVERIYIFTGGPSITTGKKIGTGWKSPGTLADAGDLTVDTVSDHYTVLSQHHKSITITS